MEVLELQGGHRQRASAERRRSGRPRRRDLCPGGRRVVGARLDREGTDDGLRIAGGRRWRPAPAGRSRSVAGTYPR
ncbi:hypothetical protein G6F60_015741 [Rhizopus arrhizus]|nr:hypothetical protein G6F60_015741 [Rhizopus arrhizus]